MLAVILLIDLSISYDCMKYVNWFKYMKHLGNKHRPIYNCGDVKSIDDDYKGATWVGKFMIGNASIWYDHLHNDEFLYNQSLYSDYGTRNKPITKCCKYFVVDDTIRCTENCSSPADGYLISKSQKKHDTSNCDKVASFCKNVKYIDVGTTLKCNRKKIDENYHVRCDYDYSRRKQMIFFKGNATSKIDQISTFLDSLDSVTSEMNLSKSLNILSKLDNVVEYSTENLTFTEITDINMKFIKNVPKILNLASNISEVVKYSFSNFDVHLEYVESNLHDFSNNQTRITFSGGDVARLLQNGDFKLSVVFWRNEKLFSQFDNFTILTPILGVSINNTRITDFRSTIVFPQNYSSEATCVYLNLTTRLWETNGCKTLRAGDHVACECSHLTNFAVIFDPSLVNETPRWITAFTNVGLGISLLLEFLTIIFSISHWSKGKKSHSFKTFLNLCAAVFSMNMVFAFGLGYGKGNICGLVGFLLHFTFLAVIAWMLVEGVLFYYLFINVLTRIPENFSKISFWTAWILPLIPPSIISAINWKLYLQKNICWLSGVSLYVGFYLPVGVCLFTNLIIFVMILKSLYNGYKKNPNYFRKESTKVKKYFMIVGLIFLFGIRSVSPIGFTWSFGFLFKFSHSIFIQFLFALFNAFFGLYIFLVRYGFLVISRYF